jgi:hypothetical protein
MYWQEVWELFLRVYCDTLKQTMRKRAKCRYYQYVVSCPVRWLSWTAYATRQKRPLPHEAISDSSICCSSTGLRTCLQCEIVNARPSVRSNLANLLRKVCGDRPTCSEGVNVAAKLPTTVCSPAGSRRKGTPFWDSASMLSANMYRFSAQGST